MSTLEVFTHASLATHNTFGIRHETPLLMRAGDPAALRLALDRAPDALVLGGGSNVLLVEPPAAVLLPAASAWRVVAESAEQVGVECEAGMPWHAFVMAMLGQGWSGLENLALIPGTVGAAPVQNIGAYGAEIASRIDAVQALDRTRGTLDWLPGDECAFAYRDSLFKQKQDRYLVTAVRFRLDRSPVLNLGYAGLAEALAPLPSPTAMDVAQAVIAIRRRKLPDPMRIGNAGSFFKNPVVETAFADALAAREPGLPRFPAAGNTTKLSAAWLIERCGWKGVRRGDAGVSPDHALVLVNHGQAKGAQLLALARDIAGSVQARFGVPLEPEPRIIGDTW